MLIMWKTTSDCFPFSFSKFKSEKCFEFDWFLNSLTDSFLQVKLNVFPSFQLNYESVSNLLPKAYHWNSNWFIQKLDELKLGENHFIKLKLINAHVFWIYFEHMFWICFRLAHRNKHIFSFNVTLVIKHLNCMICQHVCFWMQIFASCVDVCSTTGIV